MFSKSATILPILAILFVLQSLSCVSHTVSALKCGISQTAAASSRIIGGVEAKPGQFPWMAYVRTKLVPTKPSLVDGLSITYFTCGGSLIASQWIVTAAHCVTPVFGGYATGDTLATLGAFDHADGDGEEITLRAEQIYVHKLHNRSSATSNHDIALIKLESPLEIAPICLPNEGDYDDDTLGGGGDCKIIGWGRTATDDPISQYLEVTDIELVPLKQCTKHWGTSVNELKLCAGDANHRTCRGDSGGPLQCANEDRQWVLRGVTSFSDENCEKDIPSVFTNMEKYVDWIEKTMQDDEDSQAG